jgi:disulfide bond formation protein DsbB
MPEEKKMLFSKDYQRYIIIGAFYILLIAIARPDLQGTALIVFAATAGMGIYNHGLKIVDINICKDKEVK